jgi:hypothetical protein
MENLLFAAGIVLPVFLMVGSGYLLRRKGAITREFCDVAARFNFRLCFPALVFDSLYGADILRLFTGKLAFLSLTAVFASLAVSWLAGTILAKDLPIRGSFIQGAFRGNIVFMAMPMVLQVFGEASRAQTAILMAIIVPTYNIVTVIVLATHASGGRRMGFFEIAKSILTNPMILGVLAALPFALTGTGIPRPLSVFVRYFSGMTVPLALVDIGANIFGRSRPKHAGRVFAASTIKTIVCPALYGGIFALAGMDGRLVAVMVLLGASPAAMGSFTMARAMGCDADLAGDIVLVSTLMSAFTIAGFIAFLRYVGLA